MLRPRRAWWLILPAAVSVAGGLIAWFLIDDHDVWAGLGQWVGGGGALVAAGVALWAAQQETAHRRADEARRQRANAHFILPEMVSRQGEVRKLSGVTKDPAVRNRGPEPVLNVKLVSIFIPGRGLLLVDVPEREVLLPEEEVVFSDWRPAGVDDIAQLIEAAMHTIRPDLVLEIEFEDLQGGRWSRHGTEPPVRLG
ncbi:hypothetical protein [Amycolatopsis thermophila]|uniref:Uncharacterized protein n=1 Tax=Amycolatopsis thermophila TaxID=206084 RepID=A0ABU0EMV3_9PSEU|nr:hypothetical protein [Amycolatopsis thermophila]MDQ0376562.1 hypothetical protein [Amycolatopsis thermophila]